MRENERSLQITTSWGSFSAAVSKLHLEVYRRSRYGHLRGHLCFLLAHTVADYAAFYHIRNHKDITPHVQVTFQLDADGVLNVSAEDTAQGGSSSTITITNDKGMP